jgi:heat shock protein HslJ
LAVLVVVVGCGSAATTDSTSGGPAGRTFWSETITVDGTTTTLAPVAGAPGRATLELRTDGRIVANAGCNSSAGTYSLDGSTLRVSELATTAMGCDPPALMAQDEWFAGFLRGGPSWRFEGDRLTLTSGATQIAFVDRRVADPDRPLVGITWRVDTVFGGGGTASSSAGDKPTITFAADGTLSYTDSCAGGRARWRQDGSDLVIHDQQANPTVATCPPSADSAEDRALRDTLDAGASTMAIEGPSLTLRRGDEGIGLRAEGPPPTR